MACLSVMEWQAVQGVLRFSSRSAGIGLLYACFLGGLTFLLLLQSGLSVQTEGNLIQWSPTFSLFLIF